MRIARLFVDLPLTAPAQVQLPEPAAHHALRVLRLRAGDPVVLFNGRDGRNYRGEFAGDGRSGAQVVVSAASEPQPEAPLHITLAQGISRGERMDLVLQKATELGVNVIQPLFCERSVVRLQGERLEARQRHWTGVIRSASEQCGRTRLPQLRPATTLGTWLERYADDTPIIQLDPAAACALRGMPPPAGRIGILVGPEGGLSAAERAMATTAGCRSVHLGPRVLRTETAPLAALAIIQAMWGDLG
jgi:16S rRNA (uracil1498-N3)-methyltransferase